METEDTTLELFLRDRIKDKGITLKKLSDLSGVSINHIENMLRGDFEHVPPMPYFRGYLIRIGAVLDFDGEAWWLKIKREEGVRKSGPTDALPRNRFARTSRARSLVIWGTAAVFLVLILILALPHIVGEPGITIAVPGSNPYATTSDTIVIQGTAKNADSVYVNGDEATIASDGSWQQTVLLQGGMNTFDISAKKFLGGTANLVEQVIYNPPMTTTSTPSSASSTATTTPGTTSTKP